MAPLPSLALKAVLGLMPVLLFLLVLVFLDSYKLVRMRTLAAAVAGGMAAAAAAYAVNTRLISVIHVDFALYSRAVSPLIEETLKAAVLLLFFRFHMIGFLVDAAILGFSAGTGFSLLENGFYLNVSPGSDVVVWAVRGIGTAMMHGGTSAVFAVVTKVFFDRRNRTGPAEAFPGLGLAFAIHAAFNQFILPPLVSTALMLVVLPAVAVNVFIFSERRTRKWLGLGFDSDMELLDLISAGGFSDTRIGRYLLSLRDRFPGEILADLFCLIRLRTELSLGAKGILLMKEAGFEVKPDPSVRDKFTELDYLEKSVGPTGMLAVAPILRGRRRDLWELHMLGRRGRRRAGASPR